MVTQEGDKCSYLHSQHVKCCPHLLCVLFLLAMNRSAAINACVSCGFLFGVLVVQKKKAFVCVCVYEGTFVICPMC